MGYGVPKVIKWLLHYAQLMCLVINDLAIELNPKNFQFKAFEVYVLLNAVAVSEKANIFIQKRPMKTV